MDVYSRHGGDPLPPIAGPLAVFSRCAQDAGSPHGIVQTIGDPDTGSIRGPLRPSGDESSLDCAITLHLEPLRFCDQP